MLIGRDKAEPVIRKALSVHFGSSVTKPQAQKIATDVFHALRDTDVLNKDCTDAEVIERISSAIANGRPWNPQDILHFNSEHCTTRIYSALENEPACLATL